MTPQEILDKYRFVDGDGKDLFPFHASELTKAQEAELLYNYEKVVYLKSLKETERRLSALKDELLARRSAP